MEVIIILLLGLVVLPASDARAQIVAPRGITAGVADGRYVNVVGDTMTGPLTLAGSSLTVTGSGFSVGGSTFVVTEGKAYMGAPISSRDFSIIKPNSSIGLGESSSNSMFIQWNDTLNIGLIQNQYNSFTGNIALQYGGGSVGIGTTAPQTKLHLSSGTFRVDGYSPAIQVARNDASQSIYIDGQNRFLSFYRANGVTPSATLRDYADGSALLEDVGGGVYISARDGVNISTSSTAGNPGAVILSITAPVTTGGAVCLNASKVLSKCTSAVDASGNCTCP